jgi:ubiquitin C-terminal hydrolase
MENKRTFRATLIRQWTCDKCGQKATSNNRVVQLETREGAHHNIIFIHIRCFADVVQEFVGQIKKEKTREQQEPVAGQV